MRNKKAREIRERVLEELGYEPNETETVKEIVRYPEFRKIFRAAKKNYHIGHNRQNPKPLLTNRQRRKPQFVPKLKSIYKKK
jgi:hypothetical protein